MEHLPFFFLIPMYSAQSPPVGFTKKKKIFGGNVNQVS